MENTVTISVGQWVFVLLAIAATLWVVWTVIGGIFQKPDQRTRKDDLLEDLIGRPDPTSRAFAKEREVKQKYLKAIREKARRDGFTDDRMRKLREERDALDSFESAISPTRPGSAGWYALHSDGGSSRSGDHCGGSSGSDSGGSSGGSSSGGSCGGGD